MDIGRCVICGTDKTGNTVISLNNDGKLVRVCLGECNARHQLTLDRVDEEHKRFIREEYLPHV